MNQDDTKFLEELRDTVVKELNDTDSEALSPEERFDIKMTAARMSVEPQRIKDAYQAIESIEDADTKARALLDVFDEIEYRLTPEAAPSAEAEGESTPEVQVVQQDDDQDQSQNDNSDQHTDNNNHENEHHEG